MRVRVRVRVGLRVRVRVRVREAAGAWAKDPHDFECVAGLTRQRAVDAEDELDEAFPHLVRGRGRVRVGVGVRVGG